MQTRTTMALLLLSLLALASPASADLVVRWDFEAGEGTIATDTTGNGNDGVFQGAPEWVEGKYGGGLHFRGDAESDFVTYVLPEGESVWTAGTVAIWVKADVVGQDVWSAPFTNHTPNSAGVQLDVDGGDPGNYRINPGGIIFGPVTTDWIHLLLTWEGDACQLYYNGTLATTGTLSDSQRTFNEFTVGTNRAHNNWLESILDDFRVYDTMLTSEEVLAVMRGGGPGVMNAKAGTPAPKDKAADVLRGESLSWVSGEFAVTHNVYVGTNFEDVNAATEPTVADIAANSFDPGLLDFGQTYYWRVDEVNGTPDKTVFKGDVWSFTAEPYSIKIPGSTIVVTASSASNEFSEPGKTLDGSGLDANDTHSINPDTMWFTAAVDLDPWIQYEFDDVKKLDVMKVWNSNGSAESAIGWGVKDVQVEYSVDGEAWDVLAEVSQFSRAPGLPTYSQYDEVAFSGRAAKYVRLNIQSNWGGVLMSYGLSEVQFSMIPVRARTPEPASGTVDVLPNAVVTWRAGREAVQHRITVSTDPNDLGSTVSSSTNSVDLGSLDLQLDQTYYWHVDEVNESEVPSVWAGPLWSLSTVPYVTVEDFETYGNLSPDRPFQTWLDGFGYSADEFIPVGYEGNGTGSGVGHDIWSLSSPQYDGQIMEGTIVKSGQLSMPLYFNNANGLAVSETTRTFDSPQDWTANGIKSLSLNIYGDPGNSGQMYVKINGTRVNYDGLSDALQRRQWIPWNIDLSGVAGNLQNVTSLAIGVEGAGATGMIYVDAIRLYALMPDMINPVVPDDSDPNLFAYYAFEGTANDSAGANHGTANGDPGYTTGRIGQAMTFDGTDDYVLLTFDQEEVWSAYAVSLWSRTDIFGQVQYRSVFNNSSSDPDFQIDVDGSDPGVYRYWGTQAGATLGPVTSDWVHLAASCDGTETKIYYNGLLVDTLDAVDTNFGRLGIGTNRGTNQPFAGSIDDVRVYNRALSIAEIAGLAGLTEPIPVSF